MKSAVFLIGYVLLSSTVYGLDFKQSVIVQLTFQEDSIQVAELIKLTPEGNEGEEESGVEIELPLVAPAAGAYPLSAIYAVSKLKPVFETRLFPRSGNVEIKEDSVVFKGRLKKGVTQSIEFNSSVPYVSERIKLGLKSAAGIDSLKIVARFTDRISPLVRPAAFYMFSQETDGSAVYQFFTLTKPLEKDANLEINVTQIPRQFDFMKRAALGVLSVMALILLVMLVRKKDGGQ